MKCWHCHSNKATLQDYRDNNGQIDKYASCEPCLWWADNVARGIRQSETDEERMAKIKLLFREDIEHMKQDYPNFDWGQLDKSEKGRAKE